MNDITYRSLQSKLTPKQREVLQEFCTQISKNQKEIAQILNISEETIGVHLKNITKKTWLKPGDIKILRKKEQLQTLLIHVKESEKKDLFALDQISTFAYIGKFNEFELAYIEAKRSWITSLWAIKEHLWMEGIDEWVFQALVKSCDPTHLLHQITPRERTILDVMRKSNSLSQEDIWKQLFISWETAWVHFKNLRKKLSIKNSTDLMCLYLEIHVLLEHRRQQIDRIKKQYPNTSISIENTIKQLITEPY